MPNVITTSPTANEIWESWILEPAKKKLEPISFNDDPVALAYAAWRHYMQGGPRWLDLDTVKPEDQDYVWADRLRRYYANKMTFDALKGEGLRTSFRQKLYAIVSNCHEYTKEDIGLLHRLPYLYEEDLCLDGLVANFTSVKDYSGPFEVTGWLSLHTRMLRSRRAGEYYHYWLRRDGSDNLHKIIIKSDDTMRTLIESLLEQPRKYSATAFAKGLQGRPEFVYYQLASLRLA